MSWQLKRCSLSQALKKIILLLELWSPLLIFPLSEAESGAEGCGGLGCFLPGLGTGCSAWAAEGGALDSFSSSGMCQWSGAEDRPCPGACAQPRKLDQIVLCEQNSQPAMDGSARKAGQHCLGWSSCGRGENSQFLLQWGCLGLWASSQGAQPWQRAKEEKGLKCDGTLIEPSW